MNYMGVVSLIFCLLFYSMVMKIVFKRLHDVCHSYSDICDGSKDFHFILYDFRSVALFSQTERRCRCVNNLIDASVNFVLLF